jgi:hypothetical protein
MFRSAKTIIKSPSQNFQNKAMYLQSYNIYYKVRIVIQNYVKMIKLGYVLASGCEVQVFNKVLFTPTYALSHTTMY